MIIRLNSQPNSHSVRWQDEGIFGCAQTWYFYLLESHPGDGWRWGAPKIGDFTGKEEVRDLPLGGGHRRRPLWSTLREALTPRENELTGFNDDGHIIITITCILWRIIINRYWTSVGTDNKKVTKDTYRTKQMKKQGNYSIKKKQKKCTIEMEIQS